MTPIITTQVFDKSPEIVWKSITNHNQMIQWFFEEIPEFMPKIGFKTKFNLSSEERNFMHLWEIIEVIPNKKIVYDWRYEEYPGAGIVTFEIAKKDNKTLLTVTSEGMETFPQEIPEFSRESCQGGWNYFIKERLTNYLG